MILTALSNLLTNNNIPHTHEEEILIPKLLTLPSIKIHRTPPNTHTIYHYPKNNNLTIYTYNGAYEAPSYATTTINIADPQLLEKITHLIEKPKWTTTPTKS